MFGPELLFSMHKCCFCCFCTRQRAQRLRAELTCAAVNGPMRPEVAPPSVFHGHNFIKTSQVAILAGSSRDISQTVHINCRSFLSRVRISVRPSELFFR